MTTSFKLLTLDEILAQQTKQEGVDVAQTGTPPAAPSVDKSKVKSKPQAELQPHQPSPKSSKRKAQTPKPPSLEPSGHAPATDGVLIDADKIQADDQLAEILQNTSRQALFDTDKQERRLRWLAFYYLSRREHSRHELRQKLLAKECDPDAIEALLDEFVEKNYQSDERTAQMIVREGIRKARGTRHIKDALKRSGVKLDQSADALIRAAYAEGAADGTVLEAEDEGNEVNWLLLAVTARSKKYGNAIPTDIKDKACQLRFLQYRGFEMRVCYEALKLTLADFEVQDDDA